MVTVLMAVYNGGEYLKKQLESIKNQTYSEWRLIVRDDMSSDNFGEVIKYCDLALQIKDHTKSYINEVFSFDHTIYDLLSLAKFYQNEIDIALFYSNKALEISPNEERLINNNKIISEYLNSDANKKTID